jgi:hypothetical protein
LTVKVLDYLGGEPLSTRSSCAGISSQSVDAELAERLAPSELAGFRAGLAALTDIRERLEE